MSNPWTIGDERERGATLVEFALVLPLLMLVVLGIVDLGMRLADGHALEDGIRDAAREVVVGNTVFAGGNFTSARPAGAAPGTDEVTLITPRFWRSRAFR